MLKNIQFLLGAVILSIASVTSFGSDKDQNSDAVEKPIGNPGGTPGYYPLTKNKVVRAGAIKAILGKIKEAEDAIEAGAEGETVVPILKQAILLGKEVNASDIVSRNVSKGRNHIKKARTEMKKENGQVAKGHLKDATAQFKKTLGLL